MRSATSSRPAGRVRLDVPPERFGQPDPGRGAEQQRDGEHGERGAKSLRLRQRPDDEWRQRARHAADVVGESLRRGANRGRIELGGDRAEAREEARPEKRRQRTEQRQHPGIVRLAESENQDRRRQDVDEKAAPPAERIGHPAKRDIAQERPELNQHDQRRRDDGGEAGAALRLRQRQIRRDPEVQPPVGKDRRRAERRQQQREPQIVAERRSRGPASPNRGARTSNGPTRAILRCRACIHKATKAGRMPMKNTARQPNRGRTTATTSAAAA